MIDYSQTIDRFTLLDAYLLPKIDELVNKIAQYQVCSTIDLRSAYHQVPISSSGKLYKLPLRLDENFVNFLVCHLVLRVFSAKWVI